MYLMDKIKTKTAKIAILGLGYVGLPLAVECGKAGYSVTGIDLNEEKIEMLNQGKNYIPDISDKDIVQLVGDGKLKCTTDYGDIAKSDVIWKGSIHRTPFHLANKGSAHRTLF